MKLIERVLPSLFTIIFVFISLLTSSSYGAVFFSTNWDTGTPDSCWPCKQTSCKATFEDWAQGTEPPSAISGAGISTTVANSGGRSFRQLRPAGLNYGCDIVAQLPTHPTTIHVRFYLYLTSAWKGSWTDNTSWMHWIFTNSMYGSTGFRLNFAPNAEWDKCPAGQVCMIPEGHGGRQWWSNVTPAWAKGINFKDYIGKWLCLEYKMQISGSNVILTEWVNGTQTRGPSTGPGADKAYFDKIFFSGWANKSVSADADYYIDDIVVADSYIGPNGSAGGVTPPLAPKGLKIQ